MSKNLDKIRGCLIGGAAGDALGYAVEFMYEKEIIARYGDDGITEYSLRGGVAEISDDTQMTLFTANGLLAAEAQGARGNYLAGIADAYKEWYKTQTRSMEKATAGKVSCWLMNIPELYSCRAPGNTCMHAIAGGCKGSIEEPVNGSKGCGGVMRVAPIGLFFDESVPDSLVDMTAARAAALTHGHELGYIPAALLAHIVRKVSLGSVQSLKDAVLDGLAALKLQFDAGKSMESFEALILKAVALAEEEAEDLHAIHLLGQGWVGDEAIAIAIFCALKYENDFDKALIAAVNHKGDSDSTGAVCGNILGAYLGLSRIPEKYLDKLELYDVIIELADDLYYGCASDEAWQSKYVRADYKGKTET